MKDDLHITLIQTSLHWEDREANLRMLDEKVNRINERTDLIVLPEMFTTGFSMHPEKYAETMNGDVMKWMELMAKKKNAVICGSMMMKDEGKFFNRLIWMRSDGSFEQYDKRHLFGLGEEHNHYTAGNKKNIVDLKGWKILPLICYDLRFPVWCRNENKYDLLLFVANWPERRSYAWNQLLAARAIENQSYTAAVNRVGNDGYDIYHSGESCVIDPKGEILWKQSHDEIIHALSISYHHLTHIRESFPFLKDRDNFIIT